VKNGRTHTGKPNHKCQNCGRQFVQDSQQKIISAETKKTIDKLLAEKIPLAGIARVVDVPNLGCSSTSIACMKRFLGKLMYPRNLLGN
jgi:transposase-like protein